MDPRSYQNTYGCRPDYLYADLGATDTAYSPSAPSMSRGPSIESRHSATYNGQLSPVTPVLMADNMDYYATSAPSYDEYDMYDPSLASKPSGTDAGRWYGNDTPVSQQPDMTMYPPTDWSMAYATAPYGLPEAIAMPFGHAIPGLDPDPGTFEAPAEANGAYVCPHGGCESKPFKRKADLERHVKHVHVADEDKEKFYCDYPRCQRAGDAFHRIDHCRDHYRDFHLEDLARRKGESDDWYRQRRNVPRGWWRCTRCLGRVRVEKHSFECPGCRVPCDKRRQRLREH